MIGNQNSPKTTSTSSDPVTKAFIVRARPTPSPLSLFKVNSILFLLSAQERRANHRPQQLAAQHLLPPCPLPLPLSALILADSCFRFLTPFTPEGHVHHPSKKLCSRGQGFSSVVLHLPPKHKDPSSTPGTKPNQAKLFLSFHPCERHCGCGSVPSRPFPEREPPRCLVPRPPERTSLFQC